MREAASSAAALRRLRFAVPLVAGCALLFGPGLAHAQSGPPEIQSKVVPSGEKRQLAFIASLNPNCSANAEITVRAVKQASHGTMEIVRGIGYTTYEREDSRYFCNRVLTEGFQISYAPKDNFKGEDEFEIEVFDPGGEYSVTRYAITVK